MLYLEQVVKVVMEQLIQVTHQLFLLQPTEHLAVVVDQPTTEHPQMVVTEVHHTSLEVVEVEHETVTVVTELLDKVELDIIVVVVDQTQVSSKEKMVEVLTPTLQVVTEVL